MNLSLKQLISIKYVIISPLITTNKDRITSFKVPDISNFYLRVSPDTVIFRCDNFVDDHILFPTVDQSNSDRGLSLICNNFDPKLATFGFEVLRATDSNKGLIVKQLLGDWHHALKYITFPASIEFDIMSRNLISFHNKDEKTSLTQLSQLVRGGSS